MTSEIGLVRVKPRSSPLRISPSVTVPTSLKFEFAIRTILKDESINVLMASSIELNGDNKAFVQISLLIIYQTSIPVTEDF